MVSDRLGPPAAEVRELELDGDISLYDPRTQNAAVLNATASDVWRLLDGEHSLDGIVGLLAAAYGVAAEVIAPDVERTVAELVEGGFLSRTGDPAGAGDAVPATDATTSEPADK